MRFVNHCILFLFYFTQHPNFWGIRVVHKSCTIAKTNLNPCLYSPFPQYKNDVKKLLLVQVWDFNPSFVERPLWNRPLVSSVPKIAIVDVLS